MEYDFKIGRAAAIKSSAPLIFSVLSTGFALRQLSINALSLVIVLEFDEVIDPVP